MKKIILSLAIPAMMLLGSCSNSEKCNDQKIIAATAKIKIAAVKVEEAKKNYDQAYQHWLSVSEATLTARAEFQKADEVHGIASRDERAVTFENAKRTSKIYFELVSKLIEARRAVGRAEVFLNEALFQADEVEKKAKEINT